MCIRIDVRTMRDEKELKRQFIIFITHQNMALHASNVECFFHTIPFVSQYI